MHIHHGQKSTVKTEKKFLNVINYFFQKKNKTQ